MVRSIFLLLLTLVFLPSAEAQTYQWEPMGKVPLHSLSVRFLLEFFLDSMERISVPIEPLSTDFLRSTDCGVTWTKTNDTTVYDPVSGWIIAVDSGGVVAQFDVSGHGMKGGPVADPHQWFTERLEFFRNNTCPWIAVSRTNKLFFPNFVILTSVDTMKHIRLCDVGGRFTEGYYYNIDSVLHYDRTFAASSILSDRESTIIVGTKSGIFVTSNEGTSWQRSNAGLSDTSIAMIRMTKSGDIIALTDSGRFFRGKQVVTSVLRNAVTTFPAPMTLWQNFPDPFNPNTTIRFSLTAPGYISLTIHDLLGRSVSVLVNGLRPAGEQEVQWNASGFPSGIYFYTLRHGTDVRTRRMLLLK